LLKKERGPIPTNNFINCSEEENAMIKYIQALAQRTSQLQSVDHNPASKNLTMKLSQKSNETAVTL
jgi:hypothetical protein